MRRAMCIFIVPVVMASGGCAGFWQGLYGPEAGSPEAIANPTNHGAAPIIGATVTGFNPAVGAVVIAALGILAFFRPTSSTPAPQETKSNG